MRKKLLCLAVGSAALFNANLTYAADEDLNERISKLEKRIQELEVETKSSDVQIADNVPVTSNAAKFMPDISLILNGAYTNFSRDHTHIRGFQVGHEGEKGDGGFSLGESELNLQSNIDDKFMGNFTMAIVNEEGEDKIEIEEAYIKTLALPYGLSLMAGRMFANFGYLNNKHTHTDDFYDRPLPYRTYFNKHYNDDGAQLSLVLPTDFYSEIGGGAYRGASFPADDSGSTGIGAYNLYAKIGGDIGVEHVWQAGVSYLHTKSNDDGRSSGHSGHDEMSFTGEDDFYGVDLKYTFSPNGNNREREFILQGEYIFRKEKGQYDVGSGFYDFDSSTNGWYAQTVYKFHPEWRVGYRYSELNPKKLVPIELQNTVLDSKGHKPSMHTAMIDWNNSEFSRIRLQYSYDESDFKPDNQVIIQYTMSFGAHGAHSF